MSRSRSRWLSRSRKAADNSPAAESHRKGAEAFDKGETDAAIKWFGQAIQLDAKYAPAYCDRGLALVLKGDLDKAVADLNMAVQLDPGGAGAISIVVLPIFRRANTTRPWPTIPTPFGCTPAMPRPTAIGAMSAC